MIGNLRRAFAQFDFSDLVTRDWAIKIVSLLLAGVLWYFVGGEDRVDKNVMVPIEIINLPRDLVISNQFKKEIEVSVSGPRALILDMSNSSVSRQIDLSTATPGSTVIENRVKDIPVPRGITVQRVQPETIILSLDKLIQRQFPVSAKTVGDVARGYVLEKVKTDPDVISITGPQTTLSQYDELLTKVINIDGFKKSTQLQVPLELEPAVVDLIGETSVTVDLAIRLVTETRVLDDMQVSPPADESRTFFPDHVKITLNVPKLLLDQKLDPREMVEVIAQPGENLNEGARVQVFPKAGLEYPLEVLSVIPGFVSLMDITIHPESASSAANAPESESLDKLREELQDGNTDSEVVILRSRKRKITH